MIKTPTVLILGAGASINYGFPSGLQLKNEICREISRYRKRECVFGNCLSQTTEGSRT